MGKSTYPPSWETLAAEAGRPEPRLFEERDRLFGAEQPALRLWHDAAAWHPFANQVWLLIEAMRIPHVRMLVPHPSYRKVGSEVDDARMAAFQQALPGRGASSVPYVQLAEGRVSSSASAEIRWSAPLPEQSAVDLLRALHARFPAHSLLPRTPRRRAFCEELLNAYEGLQSALYGVLQIGGGRVSRSDEAAYVAAMDAFEAAYTGSPGSTELALGDDNDGDGDVARFGGLVVAPESPFLLGPSPCAVDVLLLPLLERCEANVPHPIVGTGSARLALGRWPGLARLLNAARSGGEGCSIAPLLSDPTTTVGIRLAVTGAVARAVLPPPPADGGAAAAVWVESDSAGEGAAARRDAAARLCAKGAAVARFAAGGAGTGRPRKRAKAKKGGGGGAPPSPSPSSEDVGAVDAALRLAAGLMLLAPAPNAAPQPTCGAEGAPGDSGSGGEGSLLARAQGGAGAVVGRHGPGPARRAAEALVFLAENTGVPRDMDAPAGRAFRSHLLLVSGALSAATAARV